MEFPSHAPIIVPAVFPGRHTQDCVLGLATRSMNLAHVFRTECTHALKLVREVSLQADAVAKFAGTEVL